MLSESNMYYIFFVTESILFSIISHMILMNIFIPGICLSVI